MPKAVIVGVGQYRRNPKIDGPFEPWEPAAMMAEAIRRAIADTGSQGDATAEDIVDCASLLACVDPIAWAYDDLCASVAAASGLRPGVDGLTVQPGGNSPGELLNQIANRIADGEVSVALLAGSECVYGRRRAMKEQRELAWTPASTRRDFLKGQRPLTNAIEARHGLTAPIHVYPMFENALRHKAGRSIDVHQAFLGAFMARNAAVAANNPYAWFPRAYTPSEISNPSPDNRMVCFPYPKRMNSVMEVDLSAAVIVMSDEEAARRGIPHEHQVAILGGASAIDAWTITERRDFTSSPAIRAASSKAMEHAGISVSEIDLFDFYSCFPSVLEIALSELGIDVDDERGVTVTGGLAYAGGPGNSYSCHGLAAMTERLRDPKNLASTGLVSALGMTATKHAYAVLSTDPTRVSAAEGRTTKLGAVNVDAPTLVDERSGPATVETYTAEFGRDGATVRTTYVVRFDDGSRTVANGPCSSEEVVAITTAEAIGRRGIVTAGRIGSNPSNPAGEDNVPNRFEFA